MNLPEPEEEDSDDDDPNDDYSDDDDPDDEDDSIFNVRNMYSHIAATDSHYTCADFNGNLYQALRSALIERRNRIIESEKLTDDSIRGLRLCMVVADGPTVYPE